MSEEESLKGNAQPTENGDAVSVGENREEVQVADKAKVPSYDWHKRVLGESRKVKARNTELETELERYQQAEMEAKGEDKALIAALRDKLSKAESANREKDQVFSWAKRTDAIRNVAKDMGCANTQHLLRHLEAENLLDEIEVDDNYSPNRDDVSRVVESLRSNPDYDYLFRQKAHKADMVSPNPTVEKKGPRKIADLSADEIAKILANPDLQKELLG